ncbi:hypothetical protein BDY21DRAFT_371265 [Lineolata rhizophorae]|uniref:Nudix hydrolase domain-containing protein n=1 Tax=Lineolata rhizophorae TaxID=578093 RepID=A0A6A6P372_9PEZI|nr:hypothetical protein BDY21DRAFT_371265 [Lineolata rhizophorae]
MAPLQVMTNQRVRSFGQTKRSTPEVPRPSASVLLISPSNQVLLLHRVQTSSSFPSAHVFPGGNLSTYHEEHVPQPDDPARHQDSDGYRRAAIRETFEESGILLATGRDGRLLEIDETERERARKLVHTNKLNFREWVAEKGGRPDIDGLVPFTRWITPTYVRKRFTTQMYVYFLPVSPPRASSSGSLPTNAEAVIPLPSPDGGVEHTAARFLPAADWLAQARHNEIILFPPQFFLLHLVAPFLAQLEEDDGKHASELERRRRQLHDFITTGDPPWGEKVICPEVIIGKRRSDGRTVLALDKPGWELRGSGRRGDLDWAVLVKFRKEGPRHVEVAKKKDILDEERIASARERL